MSSAAVSAVARVLVGFCDCTYMTAAGRRTPDFDVQALEGPGGGPAAAATGAIVQGTLVRAWESSAGFAHGQLVDDTRQLIVKGGKQELIAELEKTRAERARTQHALETMAVGAIQLKERAQEMETSHSAMCELVRPAGACGARPHAASCCGAADRG